MGSDSAWHVVEVGGSPLFTLMSLGGSMLWFSRLRSLSYGPGRLLIAQAQQLGTDSGWQGVRVPREDPRRLLLPVSGAAALLASMFSLTRGHNRRTKSA